MNKAKKAFPWGWLVFGAIFLFMLSHKTPVLIWVIYGLIASYSILKKEKDAESSKIQSIVDEAQPVVYVSALSNQLTVQTKTQSLSSSLKEPQKNKHLNSTYYRIPEPPKELFQAARWIPYGVSVTIADYTIDGGMLYVGANAGSRYAADPALIDTKQSVARQKIDFTQDLMSYWPSYSEISPKARSAYLNWLADGKKHPEAEIGYVFLYFYGLERRALIDIKKDKSAELDKPFIINELIRLLGIYGSRSSSFKNYASNLLQFIQLSDPSRKYYAESMMEFPVTYEMPYQLRIALGQIAKDDVPLSPELAWIWIRHDFRITQRTPTTRCKAEFHSLFLTKYQEAYPKGIKLPVNRTKLKLVYYPASAGFQRNGQDINVGELPDITVVNGPINKLQNIVDNCNAELEPYSRFIGRNPAKRDALEALLQLPVQLWPATARAVLDSFKTRTATTMVELTFVELVKSFNSTDELSRDKIRRFARALESEHICMEPDVLVISTTIKPEDKVVLFECSRRQNNRSLSGRCRHPRTGILRCCCRWRIF